MAKSLPTCPLCGSLRLAVRYTTRDWQHATPGEFSWLVCTECGLLRQFPPPSPDLLAKAYPPTYSPYTHRAASHGRSLAGSLRRLRWRTRCRQITRLRHPGRLLDVGAGTGLFLREMKSYRDWTVQGIEPNAAAAAIAREDNDVPVLVAEVETVDFAEASFDVITMWDVLEHLFDPMAALARLRPWLAPGGFLVVSSPNASSWEAALFGRYWIGLDSPRHLTAFHRATLARILRRAGFEPRHIYSFYGGYSTFALSLRQRLRASFPRVSAQRFADDLLFFPVWRWFSLPVFWLVDRLGRGSILTAVAQKHDTG